MAQNQEITPFDYKALTSSPEIQQEAQQIAAEIQQHYQNYQKQGITFVFKVGSLLAKMKEQLDHGQFLSWAENEFQMNKMDINRYVNVHQRFGELFDENDKSNNLLLLKKSVLYELSAPSCSEQVRLLAMQKSDVSLQDVREWKKEHPVQVLEGEVEIASKAKKPKKTGKSGVGIRGFKQRINSKAKQHTQLIDDIIAVTSELNPEAVADTALIGVLEETKSKMEQAIQKINLLIL